MHICAHRASFLAVELVEPVAHQPEQLGVTFGANGGMCPGLEVHSLVRTYSRGEMYCCFPGVSSSTLRLWILVNRIKVGCEGAECFKTLVKFPLRGAFVSALSRGTVSSIKCAVFPLRIIWHVSSSGAFLLMLEKSFYLALPWVTSESKGNAQLKHSLLLNIIES